MNAIRSAAVAGAFYDSDPTRLVATVDGLLTQHPTSGSRWPKAMISPHAGYIYSGDVAAPLYASLRAGRSTIRRVILLGPSHHVGFEGLALPSADAFVTPLGDIPVDQAALSRIAHLPQVGWLDEANLQEHALEVQLPFLQRSLDNFTLVPLVVGRTRPEEVSEVLQLLWGGPETGIVVSSDLSHFQDYQTAITRDLATSQRICALTSDLTSEDACGAHPINGLLHFARSQNLSIEQVDVKNSGDTAGARDKVVGYGAYRMMDDGRLTTHERQQLLTMARNSIDAHFNGIKGRIKLHSEMQSERLSESRLSEMGASFVTLNIDHQLRGCIGSLQASKTLSVDVTHNAVSAAFHDPRFPSLIRDEWRHTELHISVLTKPFPLNVDGRQSLINCLTPRVDGVIIGESGRRATYLPSVWQQLPDPARFVPQLRLKAGLPPDGWSEQTRVFLYQTEEFC